MRTNARTAELQLLRVMAAGSLDFKGPAVGGPANGEQMVEEGDVRRVFWVTAN